MEDEMSTQDLKERLALIESMIAEGRRSMAGWGWCFVLWGVAFYVAMAWTAWGPKSIFAWPVTVTVACLATVLLAARTARHQPATTLGRAVSSVWIAVGISMFVVLFALGWHGLLEQHVFMGILAAMLGSANAASSLILKWKAQFGCTLVWWIACAVCVSGTGTESNAALFVAIFVCQIVFGIYAMILESRRRGQHGVAHA
ncbi:MAG: hypothetical protein WCC26_05500 [Terracidiphilus sp.]